MIVSLVCNERCISTVCHVDDGIDRRKKLPKRLVSQVEKKRNMIRAKSRYCMHALLYNVYQMLQVQGDSRLVYLVLPPYLWIGWTIDAIYMYYFLSIWTARV